MKAIYYTSFILLLFMISCGPTAKEKEEMRQQAIQDSIALVEASKPAILKILENIEKENPSIADFFVIPEIANSIKNKYGENYYSFLQQQTKPYNNTPSKVERRDNFYGEAEMYILSFKFETKYSGVIQFQYHINEDAVDVFTNLKVANDCYSLLNPDGTFALNEGSKWEGQYLEFDEFGDPIKDKPFIAIHNSDINGYNSTYIAVMKGDENHIRFYYSLPWHPAYFSHNELNSISIKNKQDGSIRELSNYQYDTRHCVLSEEDSRYIRELCDNNPQVSFSIRFVVTSYDLFPDGGEAVVIDFEDGVAFGLSNAVNAYFYRVF